MLTELSVTNFKSWKRIEKMRLAPITGLFGGNSSGKTSVLQLPLMLKQTVESPDRAQAIVFGDDRTSVNLGSFRDVVHGHQTPGKLSWMISWQFDPSLQIFDLEDVTTSLFSGNQMTFEAQVSENGAGRLLVDSMSYGFAGHKFTLSRKESGDGRGKPKYELHVDGSGFHFIRNPGRPWDLPGPVKCYGFADQLKAKFQNAGFLADLQLAFEKLFESVYYLGPLREYPRRQYTWAGAEPADMGRRGERVVDALLAAREKGMTISRGQGIKRAPLEEYVAQWLKTLGMIHDFRVVPIAKDSNLFRVLLRQSPSSSEVLITDVGFGVSQILPVIVLCYYVPEGSTILLEQPEIHLHPSVQAGLADVFIDAVKKRKVQIIFESHSEHLLRRLQRRIAEEELDAKSASLYFCQMTDGCSELVPLEVNIFGSIKNWPKEFFGDEFGERAATMEAVAGRRKAGEK